jgi:hypothetical protein
LAKIVNPLVAQEVRVCSNKTASYRKKYKERRSKNPEQNKTRETKRVVIGATENYTAGTITRIC